MTTAASDAGGADALAADYLDRLARATGDLPVAAREELLEQIGDHVTAARAEARARGADAGPALVRAVLERLGPPGEVAAAAAAEQPATPRAPAGTGGADGIFGTRTGRESAAAVLCSVGWVFAGVGWLVGVLLAVTSPRWSSRQKLAVALLPVPVIIGLSIAHDLSARFPLGETWVVFLVAGFVASLLLGAHLVRQARHS